MVSFFPFFHSQQLLWSEEFNTGSCLIVFGPMIRAVLVGVMQSCKLHNEFFQCKSGEWEFSHNCD